MDPQVRVGLNLIRLRNKKGLSQEQLEELSEISQQYLSGMETGRRNPSIAILVRLAKALDVGLFTLLEGLDEHPTPSADGA